MTAAADDPRRVLAAWDLGAVADLEPAGGTAGRTWRVRAESGDWFLRLRGARTSSPARLRFDHGLRRHLVTRGVPTAAAVAARDGQEWLERGGRVWEVYPFVAGRAFDPQAADEIGAAAEALAEYHLAARDYRVAGAGPEPIAQYTTLALGDDVSDRMDDPRLQAAILDRLRALAPDDAGRRLVGACRERVERLQTCYAGEPYRRLTGWVLHGDYTPANLLYTPAGAVAGIFDLDWAVPGARCRDVADGLYFFATRPRRIDAGDIWSLTAAAEFDAARCALFLEAYLRRAPLAAAELDAIPAAFAGRWLSIRMEGMAKVAPADRFRFFARQIGAPLEWLDVHWEGVRARLHGSAA